MTNFKFTGVNIAAALLILAFFFPWIKYSMFMTVSISGFSVFKNGLSPEGIMSLASVGFLYRLLMVLTILVPVCAGVILYQNITGNQKFAKYYKPAHIVPAVFLIASIVILYFKMKPETHEMANSFGGDDFERSMRQMSNRMSDMAPGVFDVLGFGIYLSLLAAIYLALVSMGKVKDKEYYTPAANTFKGDKNPPTQNQ